LHGKKEHVDIFQSCVDISVDLKAVSEAFEVLSDEEKRSVYDSKWLCLLIVYFLKIYLSIFFFTLTMFDI
jgi:hypothetical protein